MKHRQPSLRNVRIQQHVCVTCGVRPVVMSLKTNTWYLGCAACRQESSRLTRIAKARPRLGYQGFVAV